MKFSLPTLLLAGISTQAVHAAIPKVLSEKAWPGKPLGPQSPVERTLSSSTATYFGECDPESPFHFTLYGPEGVGAIGVTGAASEQGITVEATGAETHLGVDTQSFFGFDESAPCDEEYIGYALEYMLDGSVKTVDGVPARVSCGVATTVIVVMKDKVGLEIHAEIKETEEGDELEILGGVKAEGSLTGSTKSKKNSKSPVSFDSAGNKKIRIKHDKENNGRGIALIDGFFNADGFKVRRTLIH